MEPGHEDREYGSGEYVLSAQWCMPQWSPVMKTGNTGVSLWESQTTDVPQWSPVMKTGNTRPRHTGQHAQHTASMEPGHEDREYRS